MVIIFFWNLEKNFFFQFLFKFSNWKIRNFSEEIHYDSIFFNSKKIENFF